MALQPPDGSTVISRNPLPWVGRTDCQFWDADPAVLHDSWQELHGLRHDCRRYGPFALWKARGLCIVTNDSDFTRVATRIREDGKRVVAMGYGEQTSCFLKSAR